MIRALLLAILATPAIGSAQQILEVDYSTGRTIIDDEWRAIRPGNLVADWDRSLLYVHDAEEPNGIMIFSLETGEWVRTISTPRGDGPFEFSQGKASMAPAKDGGLYISGVHRVITYDTDAKPVGSWTPRAPMRQAVCDLGGKPTVPIPNGVLRYELEAIGPDAVARESIGVISSVEEGRVRAQQMIGARIICTENRAFVVLTYEEGPDSVFVYHSSGEVDRVSVPTEFTEDWGCKMGGKPCPPWSRNLHPSFDDRGNLVLLSNDWRTGGTIINPETGCYAILQKDVRNDLTRVPVRVRGDSVLVFQQDQGENGTLQLFMGSTNKVSMHPLRTVSGEPCENPERAKSTDAALNRPDSFALPGDSRDALLAGASPRLLSHWMT